MSERAPQAMAAAVPAHAIAELLVHRPPLLLLDELGAHDAEGLTAFVRVSATHPFASATDVPSTLAIEYMAQAVAAHQGLLDRQAGRPICEGFLLGARRLDVHRDVLPIGLRLAAIVRRDFDLGGEFGRYACQLVDTADGTCVAEGDLKVFQSPQRVAELKEGGK